MYKNTILLLLLLNFIHVFSEFSIIDDDSTNNWQIVPEDLDTSVPFDATPEPTTMATIPTQVQEQPQPEVTETTSEPSEPSNTSSSTTNANAKPAVRVPQNSGTEQPKVPRTQQSESSVPSSNSIVSQSKSVPSTSSTTNNSNNLPPVEPPVLEPPSTANVSLVEQNATESSIDAPENPAADAVQVDLINGKSPFYVDFQSAGNQNMGENVFLYVSILVYAIVTG
jgi:hypothetical protein